MKNDQSISVYGRLVPIGVDVFRWDHPEGFNGYSTNVAVSHLVNRKTGTEQDKVIKGRRYSRRPGGVEDITQFVVHHSGGDGRTPAGMYETLHNQRKLSVHFAIEDDGRVWQFLDPKECAWHVGKHNRMSVGAECCLYPDAGKRPDFYSRERIYANGNLPHEIAHERIQGMEKAVFVMPDSQVIALARVIAGTYCGLAAESQKHGYNDDGGYYEKKCRQLWERFSNPPKFPEIAGRVPKHVIPEPHDHVGLIGHLHITRRKWDPAGFKWDMCEEFVEQFMGQFMAQMFPGLQNKEKE